MSEQRTSSRRVHTPLLPSSPPDVGPPRLPPGPPDPPTSVPALVRAKLQAEAERDHWRALAERPDRRAETPEWEETEHPGPPSEVGPSRPPTLPPNATNPDKLAALDRLRDTATFLESATVAAFTISLTDRAGLARDIRTALYEIEYLRLRDEARQPRVWS